MWRGGGRIASHTAPGAHISNVQVKLLLSSHGALQEAALWTCRQPVRPTLQLTALLLSLSIPPPWRIAASDTQTNIPLHRERRNRSKDRATASGVQRAVSHSHTSEQCLNLAIPK